MHLFNLNSSDLSLITLHNHRSTLLSQTLYFISSNILPTQIGRLPGVKSSYLHLEVFTGMDEDLAIEDLFDGPSPWEDSPQHSRCNATA